MKSQLVAVAGVALWSTLAIAQSAPPVADTFADTTAVTQNYGASSLLAVTTKNTAYLRFDLSGVPVGSTVTKATLRLFVDAVTTPGRFDVYQVNSAWSESTLTHNNAPIPGISATNAKTVSIAALNLNQFVMVDVTTVVQEWVSGTAANDGVAIALVGSTGAFAFDARRAPSPAMSRNLKLCLPVPLDPKDRKARQASRDPQVRPVR